MKGLKLLHIDILCLGNIKNNFIKIGIEEYLKRIKPFCKINIIEIKESKFIDKDEFSINKALINESKYIFSKIEKHSYIIGLFIDGNNISSIELSEKVNEIVNELFINRICFIIGSSYGLHKEVEKICDYKLSISKMTFTHEMARLLLIEQIYRSFCINNNINYHK